MLPVTVCSLPIAHHSAPSAEGDGQGTVRWAQLKNAMSRLPSTNPGPSHGSNLAATQPPGVQTNVAALNAAKVEEQV